MEIKLKKNEKLIVKDENGNILFDNCTLEDPTILDFKIKNNQVSERDLEIFWDYKGDCDGFIIYLYSDKEKKDYKFGTKKFEEVTITVDKECNKFVFKNLISNLYYTVGVQAYKDVADGGRKFSNIVQFSKEDELHSKAKTVASYLGNSDSEKENILSIYEKLTEALDKINWSNKSL